MNTQWFSSVNGACQATVRVFIEVMVRVFTHHCFKYYIINQNCIENFSISYFFSLQIL